MQSIRITSGLVTANFQSNTSPETADIEILITSRNGDRKIMHSIKITSRSSIRIRK